MTNNKVSVGVTSIVGWLTGLLALLPAIITALETGQAAFNGPEKYLAVFGIASGLITQIGRYLQAHKLIGSTSSAATNAASVLPGFEQGAPAVVLAPESAAIPDGPRNVNVTAPPASASVSAS